MERNYCIPANYLESGYLLNGRFPMRNAIEAVILFFVGLGVCNALPIPHNLEEGATYYVLIIMPMVMIGASGIQGEPLSIYLMNAYKWYKAKKPYFFNHHGKAYRVSAAQLILDEPSMRDVLADKLSQFRKAISSPRVEYVEGENFVFAEDPELEALAEAEERLNEKEMSDIEQERKNAAESRSEPSGDEKNIDLNDIMDNILLQDIEGGA